MRFSRVNDALTNSIDFYETHHAIEIDVHSDGAIWLEVTTGKDGLWSRTYVQLETYDAENLAKALQEAAEKSRKIRYERYREEVQQERALIVLKELADLEFNLKESDPEEYERRKAEILEYAKEVVEMGKEAPGNGRVS